MGTARIQLPKPIFYRKWFFGHGVFYGNNLFISLFCDIFHEVNYYLKIINTVIGQQQMLVLLLTIDLLHEQLFWYDISRSVLNKGLGSQHFIPQNYSTTCSYFLDGHEKSVAKKHVTVIYSP